MTVNYKKLKTLKIFIPRAFLSYYTLIYLAASGVALGAFLLLLLHKPSLLPKVEEASAKNQTN